ncbi:DUF1450 domain-containing protein [Paenibacillus kandeliae]|uniref:DUF1450 domain-containing protein n=1 Tax=Paenibacillus kandeliae TaxID=3231269 RepID=UPI0034593F25
MKTIQYCPKNDKLGTKQVHADIAREYPDVKQQRKGCLKECKICRRQPFVKVGKKLICADTPEQLYEQLSLLIRKQDEPSKNEDTSHTTKKKNKADKKAKKNKKDKNTKPKNKEKQKNKIKDKKRNKLAG